jgi:hypothetical protein
VAHYYIWMGEMGPCSICGRPTRVYCSDTQQFVCARPVDRRLKCRLTHEAVWCYGSDVPRAYFPTTEEAEAYIRPCQEEDQLEEEFKALMETFAGRVAQQLTITQAEAIGMIKAWASLYREHHTS